MFKVRLSHALIVLIASTALSGCARLPETSRAQMAIQMPQAGAMSAYQRAFQSQARTVVFFDFDKDILTRDARARLDEQAVWILEHDNIRFRVYGHTDKVGGDRYNYDLGLRRANRVVDYLVSKGIERQRLEAMVSYGEDSPIVDTNEREKLNRRVVTEVHGYVRPSINSATLGAGNGSYRDRTPSPTPTSGGGSTFTGSTTPDTDGGGSTTTGATGNTDSGKSPNSGRGNGDESGDPGKSGGKNNGGDEI